MPDDKKAAPSGSDDALDELDELKQEVAEDLDIPFDPDGDNGDLTAKQLGQLGGNMVKRLVRKGEEALQSDDE